jgi:hypothetical protein
MVQLKHHWHGIDRTLCICKTVLRTSRLFLNIYFSTSIYSVFSSWRTWAAAEVEAQRAALVAAQSSVEVCCNSEYFFAFGDFTSSTTLLNLTNFFFFVV